MNILSESSNITPEQEILFQQGARFLMVENEFQLAVWTKGTPMHGGVPSVAIGACILNESGAVDFLQRCLTYLKEHYAGRSIIGPMNGNTWMKHRLILESDGSPAFAMEPIEPDSLLEVLQQAGFRILSSYTSSLIDLTEVQPSYEKLEGLAARQGIEIRTVDINHFERDLKLIYELSIDAFSNNFLYTPLPEALFMQSYLSAKAQIDTDMVLLAMKDEALVGFLFCMPDSNPQTLIVKTLATSPYHRTLGLGTLLVAKVQQTAKEKGYTNAIHALQFENNTSLRISQRFSARVFRKYGLMIG